VPCARRLDDVTATFPEAMSRFARAVGCADSSRVVLSGAGGFIPEEALILGDGFSFTNTGLAPNEAAYKAGMATMRGGLSAAVQNVRGETDAALAEMALALGHSGLSGASALPWIYQAMATNVPAFATGKSVVPSRQITRGASTTTGTGNGVLTRLAIDRYGYPLENDTPEPILMTCRQDVTLGTNPGQESFDCFANGAPAGDVFQIWTAGFGDGLQAPSGAAIGVTADTAASLGVQNPSFNASSGTGVNFVLTGWTLASGSAANMNVSTTPADIYRASAIEGSTPGSLRFPYVAVEVTAVAAGSNGAVLPQATIFATNPIAAGFPTSGTFTINTTLGYQQVAYTGITAGSFTGCTGGTGTLATGNYIGLNFVTSITQTLASNGGSLDAARAYFSRLAANRSNYGGVGTVTVQVGSRSWSLYLNTQIGFVPVSPPLASPTDAANGQNLWFPNFDTNNFSVTITVSVGLGTIVIDDFSWGPFTSVAGKLLWVGGGSTNFLYGDTITFTDTEGLTPINGVINHWLSRLYPPWNFPAAVLPAAPVAAPLVVQGGAAAGPTAGVHYFAVSFVTATGESPPGPVSLPFNATGANGANLSAIPTGPGGTTARNVYMTRANGNPLSLYFAVQLAGNVATTLTVVTQDAALTQFSPSTADPP
jgi:hypothetical protein